MSGRFRKIAAIIGIAAVIGVFAAVFVLFGRPLVAFVSDTEAFREWVDKNGIVSRICFIGMVVIQVIAAAIPGEPFEIAAGYAFGALEGILLYMIGVLIGSFPIIMLVRRYGRKLLLVFFSEKQIDSLAFLKNTKKLTLIAFIVMLIPGTPKDLITYFLGLTDIRLPMYLIICGIARIPSVATSVIGGDALGSRNYIGAAVIFAAAAVISVIGLIYFRRMSGDDGDK